MSAMEIAWGYVFGHVGTLPPASHPGVRPRHALEEVIRVALRRPPCVVAFSGGRDSSVVLAVATHVARRDGLPEPVPITTVFPDAPRTDESHWQEQVLRHLRLREWLRLTIHDELDLVGPLAQAHLVAHGVLWPPTIHGDSPFVEHARGGSLIDGEGGDDVLGVAAHRIAPLTYLLRAPRPLRWRRIRPALRTLAPGRVRAKLARRSMLAERPMSWLRPAARRALTHEIRAAEIAAPLSFAASVRRVPRRRTQVLLARNRAVLGESHDVAISSPLLHPDVVQALADDGKRLGTGTRTATLRSLVPDLLPDVVLARTTKAEFGNAFWAGETGAFVEQWNGDGVDPTLVEPEELRRVWRSGDPNALTSALLQQAWLATHRSDRAAVP
jgi:asparagine synthase (glutamine-hydrolysing)